MRCMAATPRLRKEPSQYRIEEVCEVRVEPDRKTPRLLSGVSIRLEYRLVVCNAQLLTAEMHFWLVVHDEKRPVELGPRPNPPNLATPRISRASDS